MSEEARANVFYTQRPAYEWFGFEHLAPTRSSRGLAFFLLTAAWIAVVDVCWPRTNLSILYVVPLLIAAWMGELKPLWRSVGLLAMLTYMAFLAKFALHARPSDRFLDHPLFNRTLSVVMLTILGLILLRWIDWRRDQLLDAETPEYLRRQDREVSATFAMLVCAPLIVLIAGIDFLAPASYNLAILYPIPLFICGWTSDRRLLWSMLAVLLLLTFAAFQFGPTDLILADQRSLMRNRILASIGMIGVSAVLSRWMPDGDQRA